MAGQLARKGAQLGLDAVLGTTTLTARTTYIALLTAAPTDATTMATMTELTTPATNGYDRKACAWAAATAADPSSAQNSALITFGAFTADLANVTHLALVSALTGTAGDFIAYWTADVAKDPASGDSITIAAGALILTLT
ncbi:MAG: hypothetical protein ABIO83_11150 [Ilumatobacteraceae bacterium]